MNLREIAGATPRLEGLIFGAEDLAGDIGSVRTKAAWEVFYARSAVVTAAAAFRLQSFDMIYADFNDPAGLEEESRFARQLGFTGKTCIHPNQTPDRQPRLLALARRSRARPPPRRRLRRAAGRRRRRVHLRRQDGGHAHAGGGAEGIGAEYGRMSAVEGDRCNA